MQDTTRRDTTGRRAPRDTTRQPGDTIRRPRTPGDSARADSAGNIAGSLPPGFDKLDLRLNSRLEAKGEQVKNDRCGSIQLFSSGFRCQGSFQPAFDFQFNLLTRGTVADRVHVDVDYDTQREFDASNNISIRYEGKQSELLQRFEIGNVSFAPPTSRFITSGIPSGNYGVQATGRVGPMTFSAIAAQQKGNVVQDTDFVVGDRTVRQQTRDIEDYQIEPRRFFFTVDPLAFGAAYPNVDILDHRQLSAIAASLPDSVRPSKVFVYRLLLGGQPRNPNGPQFRLIGDASSQRGQVYELLRERIDYYIDPSLLWLALVTPLSQNNERLVVAYNVRINGRDTTIASTGGTPDLQFISGRDQFANLIWDPRVTPDDPAFRREIRSVYRIGGSDLRRQTVQLRILTGGSADQEKPAAGGADTYIQQFRIAEATNNARFDADNRLWPRPNDPNRIVSEGGGAEDVIKDYFLVFPSAQPFARSGLVGPLQNPANDTIYRTPGEYIYSTRHPQSFYRMRVSYESQVGDEVGTISLNAVQLRPGSERITIDGRQLVRGVDYEIDYELGRVSFSQPDALFPFARRVRVRYEENPLFTTIPTSVFGLTTQFAGEHGALNFTAISQSQRTTFTRPPLGYEPASALVAGVNGAFSFDASPLGRLIGRSLPFRDSLVGPSTIELQGEFAVSRPRPNSQGQAYIESFEGEGGLTVSLLDNSWYYGSQPTLGTRLAARVGARALDLTRATTLAWQTNGTDRNGNDVRFTIEQIDPRTTIVGTGFSAPETLLWLTLYPLGVGGQRDQNTGAYRWKVANPLPGVRWRSIRTSLGPSGADLTGAETIEFWTLLDTSAVRRATNPVLVLDLGDVSENSIAFAPETLSVRNGGQGTGASDSTYTGKKLQGFGRLDSERDQFSRAFNVDVNDTGLPGDVVDTLVVVSGGVARADTGVRICTRGDIRRRALGDSRTDCTVANSRLDEEDLDSDNALRTDERLLRYIVDLTDSNSYDRLGQCGARVDDPNGSRPLTSTLCWVHVRLPFTAPNDSINGGPLVRRVQALRITAISAAGATDDAFITTAIARLQFTGAPWLKRSSRPLTGIAGEREQSTTAVGYVVASVIGTEAVDSTRGLIYQSPPGVTDQPDNLQTPFDPTRVQINERSLRLQAGGLERYDRAEAFLRFPEGQKSFMGYKEMRLWARGRGNGWGQSGELQFFVKIGRDANNFYMYRTPVSAGASRAAWEPEIRVNFQKFFALRAKLAGAYLRGSSDSLSCSGVDSALIARSGLPVDAAINRFAACDQGYVVYTTDPAVAPPNLGSVQELAVGIVRVDSAVGPTPVMPNDTLEVWVDDIRLANVVSETGFAGQIGLSFALGDLATFRIAATRRDPNFRQLAESPSFATNNDLELATTVRLDQFLPPGLGVALPLTISHTTATVDPTFLAQSDVSGDEIAGLRTPRTSATTYALSVRRLQPVAGAWYAPIVNHLGVTGTYSSLGNRSEFQDGSRHRFNVSGDYFVTLPVVGVPEGQSRGLQSLMPQWLSTTGQAPGTFNLRPTSFRVTSGLVRDSERRESFLKPAGAPDDSGRVATGQSDLWRNTSSLEMQPLPHLTARADVVLLRDLRNYDATTPNGAAAAADRGSFLGLDAGIERERQLASSLTYAPEVAGWLRPRVDLASSFSLVRDPNAPLVLPTSLSPAPGAETGLPQLALRLGNTRTVTAGAGIDVAKASIKYAGPTSLTARVAQYLQPIDVSITRGILSSYDATSNAPGLGYQLGIGTITGFRELGGGLANSAGSSSQIVVSNGLNLPLSLAVTNRLQRTTTRNWSRRLDSDQTTIDGDQIVFPDLNVRWTPRAPLFGGLVKSAGFNGRLLHTRQFLLVPAVIAGAESEERATRVRTYPLNASLTWAPGEVTTTAGYSYRTQVDSLPGSVTNGNSAETSAELGRTFRVPADWGLKSGLRTRIGFQQARTKSYVENIFAAGKRSRLTDNGRQAFTLNADTDVAENATFSIQGSRIVNFDRNLNRRLTQTVITAVLQMQFFAGDLR